MKIGKTRIEVVSTNIKGLDVEGIINPANDMLWMGGGISAEIRKTGGDSIEKEAIGKAPAEIGTVIVTGAGKLKARWIFHAIISGQNMKTSEESIRKAMRACLEKTKETLCRSLAVPVLATGIHDIEVHIDVSGIVEETIDFLVNEKHPLEYVAFIGESGESREILNEALLEKFTNHG
ncbi:macro domain-containing protein [Candidatus Latescibacterota bacterium]